VYKIISSNTEQNTEHNTEQSTEQNLVIFKNTEQNTEHNTEQNLVIFNNTELDTEQSTEQNLVIFKDTDQNTEHNTEQCTELDVRLLNLAPGWMPQLAMISKYINTDTVISDLQIESKEPFKALPCDYK
ncbi:8760_t:CDS:2, partial [Racocetra persica]